VFCPKATAGIGGLPDTVLDRAIVIPMERRTRSERIERLRDRRAAELGAPLREALAAQVGAIESFAVAEATLPDTLDDRAQDSWEPLFAIADVAGGHWPLTARAAATAIFGSRTVADDNLGIRLLADCRAVFAGRDATVLSSAELRLALLDIDASPWADIHGREISPHYLAKLLRAFGIMPGRARLAGAKNPIACYARSAFGDAWARYLVVDAIDTSGTTGTGIEVAPRSTAHVVPIVPVVPLLATGTSNEGAEIMAAAWRIFGDDIEGIYVQGTA